MTKTIQKNFAFTLSEILITIAIIGVVAAITIPTLIEKMTVRQTVTKLKSVHSIFSQAVKLAVAENGDLDGLDIGEYNTKEGSEKLYKILKPYLKNAQDCGVKTGCFENNYKALDGKTDWLWQPGIHPYYARGTLMNGVQYAVWSGGNGCPNNCGSIFVDINGNAKPNRAGVDFFQFQITPSNIKTFESAINKWNTYEGCKYNDNGPTNGTRCTHWVLTHENMDYLKKPGTYIKE